MEVGPSKEDCPAAILHISTNVLHLPENTASSQQIEDWPSSFAMGLNGQILSYSFFLRCQSPHSPTYSVHYYSDPISHSLLWSCSLSIIFTFPRVLIIQPNFFYAQAFYESFLHLVALKTGSLLITQPILLWCQVAATLLQ